MVSSQGRGGPVQKISTGGPPSQSQTAKKRFELENAIADETLFHYDEEAMMDLIGNQRPWKRDPHFFKHCKISAVALIKMVMHAKSGDDLEIMGVMQGYPVGETMYVLDVIPLPEVGTETRIGTSDNGIEYMMARKDEGEDVHRPENIVGWYHSHPGYGCWLSGIDVKTQQLKQMSEDPALAIVIDPKMTMSAGKVEIGVFRTYKDDYAEKLQQTQEVSGSAFMNSEKFQEYGLHAHKYYKVGHSFFKSGMDTELLDRLWNEYWLHTLSSSPILSNQDTICRNLVNVVQKIKQISFMESVQSRGQGINQARGGRMGGGTSRADKSQIKKAVNELQEIQTPIREVTNQVNLGIAIEALKTQVFTTPANH